MILDPEMLGSAISPKYKLNLSQVTATLTMQDKVHSAQALMLRLFTSVTHKI
jgi:hypothetical protein